MGIYGALSSAVSGLRAQAHALENISGNIANSQTTGYKRIETEFLDLIPDAPLRRQVPGAVIAQSRSTNDIKGDIRTVANETYIALNSNGFFIVEPKVGQADGNAVFGGTDFYTRRGDFEIDKDGRLVNGAGYYLKGLPIDPGTGNISGSVPEVLQLSSSFLAAQPTTRINYQSNLPETPKTGAYLADVPGSELLVPDDYAGYVAGDDLAEIQADDNATFLTNTISGGAVTAYGQNGAPAQVQMRWAKTDSQASGGSDTWNLYYMSDSAAEDAEPMWTRVDQDFTFAPDGSLSDPTGSEINIAGLDVNGISLGDVALVYGTGGLTQFADVNGSADVKVNQNGYGAGEFISVGINDSGRVVASYSNGERIDIAQVVTAEFTAINALKRLDGGVFASTSESGEAILDLSGAGIIGASLESSNTDISDEFTKLIVTQQAYAAGTRIVTTADEMLQEALNMVR